MENLEKKVSNLQKLIIGLCIYTLLLGGYIVLNSSRISKIENEKK